MQHFFSRRSSLLSKKEIISTVTVSLFAAVVAHYFSVDLKYVVLALLAFIFFAK